MKLNSTQYSRYIVLFVCTFLLAHSQVFSQDGDLYKKAKTLVNSNPDEAIKIAEHLLKISEKPQEHILPNLLLAKGYLNKGQYKQAVSYAFSPDNILNKKNPDVSIALALVQSNILDRLALYNQADQYVNAAKTTLSQLPDSKEKSKLASQIALQEINILLSKRDSNKALQHLNSQTLKTQLAQIPDQEPKMDFNLYKAQAFKNLNQLDSADVYVKKALYLTQNITYNNIYKEALIYTQIEEALLKEQQFQDSEMTALIALRYASALNNPTLLSKIYKDLSVVNLALNRKSQYKVYNDEFLLIQNDIATVEQEAINTLFNNLQLHEELSSESLKSEYAWMQNLLLGACLTLILAGSAVVFKSENKKKRLKEVINYLEISRTNFLKLKPVPVSKSKPKNLVISEETEQGLLVKLQRFEASTKFLSKDMSLSVLAGKFETNTRYLSEVINKHYNDNFNTFINKLRIDYIIKKLQQDTNYVNYKISYLAEECGFASHSNFTTVFKSIVGMSPATFISLIKDEQDGNSKDDVKTSKATYLKQDVA